MASQHKMRRIIIVLIPLFISIGTLLLNADTPQVTAPPTTQNIMNATGPALDQLNTILVKGRAPKTGYVRTEFGNGWTVTDGCDTRNRILQRDLQQVVIEGGCLVQSGTLNDPYSGQIISFERGESTSQLVQIDHVVALSNAWQTGAQQLTKEHRVSLANDPLNLLAVDGTTNQQKSDGDSATWLPSNKAFRCEYVARQIAVKKKYTLWVTAPEKEAMVAILQSCPAQQLPT